MTLLLGHYIRDPYERAIVSIKTAKTLGQPCISCPRTVTSREKHNARGCPRRRALLLLNRALANLNALASHCCDKSTSLFVLASIRTRREHALGLANVEDSKHRNHWNYSIPRHHIRTAWATQSGAPVHWLRFIYHLTSSNTQSEPSSLVNTYTIPSYWCW